MRIARFPVDKCSVPPGTFFGSTRVRIGEGTHISYGCVFDSLDWITIGKNCDIATCCLFITSTHAIGGRERRAGESKHAPIVIEDGCWIGGGVTILPGVRIGAGTIIGAGSVVIRDCEANSVYVGVPAVRKGPVVVA